MTEFDPSYGYTKESLLNIESPDGPEDFCEFWRQRFARIRELHPQPEIRHTGRIKGKFELYDLIFQSSSSVRIYGWVLIPIESPVNRALVVGHGYGGCDEPSGIVPLDDAAYLYPSYRGIARSRMKGIPEDPNYHVLYQIDDRDNYIHGGCVEDTWMAVSAVQKLFPSTRGRTGFMGISFSGGIGALALPWDPRIARAHFQVPSFGHHPLRLELPSYGSANAIQNFYRLHPKILETLMYYDAAVAAKYIEVPVHVAPALSDPVVAPPGQFAIYNSLKCERSLFVLSKGHQEYRQQETERQSLLADLSNFFKAL